MREKKVVLLDKRSLEWLESKRGEESWDFNFSQWVRDKILEEIIADAQADAIDQVLEEVK